MKILTTGLYTMRMRKRTIDSMGVRPSFDTGTFLIWSNTEHPVFDLCRSAVLNALDKNLWNDKDETPKPISV